MKYLILLLPFIMWAEVLKVGDKITPLSLHTQFEKEVTVSLDGVWIVSFDRDSSDRVNHYFTSHDKTDDIMIMIDASDIPSLIFSMFVEDDLRGYSHAILVNFDKNYMAKLPQKKEANTLLYLQKGVIEKIVYVQSERALSKVLKHSF